LREMETLATGRCIVCGRLIEIEEFSPPEDDDYYDYEEEKARQKKVLFCQICEAKLRREADEAQKNPKPM